MPGSNGLFAPDHEGTASLFGADADALAAQSHSSSQLCLGVQPVTSGGRMRGLNRCVASPDAAKHRSANRAAPKAFNADTGARNHIYRPPR
jgi:hypothetical protein